MNISSLLLHIMLYKICSYFQQFLYKNTNSKNVVYYNMFVIWFSLKILSENISNQKNFAK